MKDDVRRIQTFHDETVVVSMTIVNYDVKKILIDNESSTNILFSSTFFRMQLPIDRLRRISTSLVDFTENVVTVEEKITLPLTTITDP